MRNKLVLAAVFMAVASLVVAFATTASAFPGVSEAAPCSGCHSGAGTNPVATLVSNNGTTATYNVSSGGMEWAVFNGSTRIAGQPGSTGQFSVAVGSSYTLFAVNGFPGPLGVTTVTPTAPVTMFTITASAGPNGAIAPGSVMVASGANQKFTITPNSGFHVASLLVDGSPATLASDSSFTFTNVTANHTIAVTFAMDTLTTFTLTPSAGANGTISPATPQVVTSGSDSTFMMHANAGFHVADVLVDGSSVGAVGSYTFDNVAADHTISVSFAANPVGMFTITPSAGANGSISPATAQVVNAGSNQSFTITPDSGYHIESVSVDGVVIPTVSSYTFTNVQANHTIMATFSNDADNPAPTHLSLKTNDHRIEQTHHIVLTAKLTNTEQALFFGSAVRYEYKSPGSHTWHLLKTVLVALDGSSTSGRIKLSKRGTWSFRTRYLGTDDFAPSTSNTVKVFVAKGDRDKI